MVGLVTGVVCLYLALARRWVLASVAAALATNKLQSAIGTFSAFLTFLRAGRLDLRPTDVLCVAIWRRQRPIRWRLAVANELDHRLLDAAAQLAIAPERAHTSSLDSSTAVARAR